MISTSLSVACIGLGRIGSGIAHSIQASGCRFAVYNRTPEKMQPFVKAGATAARAPREAAERSDVVITSLMDDDSVLNTVIGEDGILAGLRAGAIHIGTSTISPNASIRINALHEANGSFYLSAPVLGRPEQAAAGKLISLVAGKPDVIERTRPALETYSAKVIALGSDPAVAAGTKLAINFFAAGLLELVGQAFVFAEKRGLDVAVVAGIYKELFHHPALPAYLDRIRTRNFDGEPGFTLDGGAKDIRLILDAAAEVCAPLPYASLIRDKFITAQAHGLGQRDWSAFTEVSRWYAGMK